MRQCNTCQHLKRPEIDRRLAAGEPAAQVARDHDLNPSSLHRHRTNCLKLALFQPDQERGGARQCGHRTAAVERELWAAPTLELRARIDQIVEQAQQAGIAQCCDLWTELHSTNAGQSCPTGGAPPTRQYAGECRRTDQRQCWRECKSPNGSFRSSTMNRKSKRRSRKHYWR